MKIIVKQVHLWEPDLSELVPAVQAGLEANYATVSVELVQCPDLRRIGCATAGISGSTSLVEVGGEPYAHNPKYRDIEFDTSEIARCCDHPRAAVFGAGMAHRRVLNGHCGEWIPTLQLNGANYSKAARVGFDKACIIEPYPFTLHTGLSNLFLSDGKPGLVLKISVEQRIGDEASFSQAIRKSLLNVADIGNDKQIGMGGVFVIEKGQIRSHISPDYECITHSYYDIETEQVVADFLQFYEGMGPDLLCFSVFWTGDPTGGRLHLRDSGEHTHFFHQGDLSQGGHYHYDITPEVIKYTGYFNVAAKLYRVHDIYEEIAKAT